MGKVYREAESVVYDICRDVMDRYHQDLAVAKFRVGIRMVTNADGPAITHHGAPALASIRKLAPKDHVFQNYDAIIDIDGGEWQELSDPQRKALIDHELTHAVVVKDKGGEIKRYKNGRLNWAMRPDDWSITGFADVVGRWGQDSIEHRTFIRLTESYEQLWLPFTEAVEGIEKLRAKQKQSAKQKGAKVEAGT